MSAASCPACAGIDLERFHEQRGIPTNSCLLLRDAEEAQQYPTGDLALAFCRSCGFVFNEAFDAKLSEYSSRYEETQAFSPKFVDFARGLAKRWVDDYDLAGKRVLEIGCGKGEFLVYMAEAGIGEGIGIDPGVHPERIEGELAPKLSWIADFYSEDYAHLAADAIVCRHTLEHIQPVGEFLRTIRRSIGDRTDTIVLFELPDVLRVLQEVAFWDVYYEHCSYFTPGSLARLFRANGFDVVELELDYDAQYILLAARPVEVSTSAALPLEDDLDATAGAVAHFRGEYARTVAKWQGELRAVRERGGRTVIWGAGSKGVAYLTTLAGDAGIDYAVDVNPYKHGMYMAGTGQHIVAPQFLREYQPELVVAMNPIYVAEIRNMLDDLGVDATLEAV